MNAPFVSPRKAALALLNSESTLTRKAGSFLGQVVADPSPLTEAQCEWLKKLLERAGLPSIQNGDHDD